MVTEQDRLVTAVCHHDLPSIDAAIGGGASVNADGGFNGLRYTPLRAAVHHGHADVVERLLAYCADVNGDGVMWEACTRASIDVLQQVVDAGGDASAGAPLLAAIKGVGDVEQRVRVLLPLPELDLTVTDDTGRTAEQVAMDKRLPAVAALIRDEVRCSRSRCCWRCLWKRCCWSSGRPRVCGPRG